MPGSAEDLVVYHNPDRMGYAVEDAQHFRAETNKQLALHSYGARIWVVGGTGQPRQFHLVEWFIVERVQPSQVEGFRFSISGSGEVLTPPIPLNDLDWFERFKHTQANFSLGFNPIPPEFVPHFQALLDGQ
jgi:hypothetical protein